ncbi:MAG TPA: class I SAM-dependent methyltransferase [Actinomycetota bacterium]|nr:class I SAM-dependent methyltransferase [Actinomycetota bacterium]
MSQSHHDYTDQAARYDRTRSASPSVLRPLRAALSGAPGKHLVDVGGGTGNYSAALARDGFRPIVLDVSPEMLGRARTKGLAVLRGSAASLPVRDGVADAVSMVSMLHLVVEWRSALSEARRVLRPGGALAIMAYTRDQLEVLWVLDYFPDTREWLAPEHQSIDELVTELRGAQVTPFEFEDLDDGSMAALCRHPHLILDSRRRAQTSYFERLERSDPDALRRGLDELERDLARGRRPQDEVSEARSRLGDGCVIAWTKPI